jgi:argininosuccinate synthase
MTQRMVLAYSGRVDAPDVIASLRARYDADIVAVTVDLGQEWPLDHLRASALAGGAVRAHVIDARAEFARDYVLPALQAGAVYDGTRLMALSLGQLLIARKLVDIARIEQVAIIACDGRELQDAIRSVAPGITVVAATGTDDSPVDRPVSHHRQAPIARVKDLPAHVAISFERGVPISVNGVTMEPIELLESVATIAAGQGVGLAGADHPAAERTICDAPAAIVLQAAHQALDASAHERLSGVVRMMLSEGACTIEGVEPQFASESL